ncbi:SURF1 family protein [Noviherbaspirillum malthae]|jgi:cytochrome oxidase assembly protein ShyY1|uniref:SURF1 family protein n=1 Tax=Noviherbaspirillum malthae TaxID=1260987 RepID=UPI00188F0C07|nr:SURF1 family protein [Noviherbaspirillum malthae]
MPLTFRFRWIPFLAAVTVAVIGFMLGNWQTRRAHEKEAIEAKLQERSHSAVLALDGAPKNAGEMEYRRVSAKGSFVGNWTIYLENRPYQGSPGFYVLSPLKIDGSDMHILVVRGWVKRDATDRAKLPPIATPTGLVEIIGTARANTGHVLQLGTAEPLKPGAIVQNAEIADIGRAAGIALQPFVVEQTSDAADGLVRDWPRPSSGADKHRGYAFQWYALAATALLFFVVTGFRRGKKST